jgi:hypothetical protein
MEEFICKIEGLGLICKKNSKTRGLGVNSVNGMDVGLISKKVRGYF